MRSVPSHRASLPVVCSAAVGKFGRDGPHGEALHNEVLLHEGGGVASVSATAPLLGGIAEKEGGGAASGDALSELPRGTCGRRKRGSSPQNFGLGGNPGGPSGAAGGAGARRRGLGRSGERLQRRLRSALGGTRGRALGSGAPSLRAGGLERSRVRRAAARARTGRGEPCRSSPGSVAGGSHFPERDPGGGGTAVTHRRPRAAAFYASGSSAESLGRGAGGAARPQSVPRWRRSAPLPWVGGGERPGG